MNVFLRNELSLRGSARRISQEKGVESAGGPESRYGDLAGGDYVR